MSKYIQVDIYCPWGQSPNLVLLLFVSSRILSPFSQQMVPFGKHEKFFIHLNCVLN